MRILLDTCTFLWLATEPDRLSPAVVEQFRDPRSEVLLSSVSAWEIMVKHALGRLPLPRPPRLYVPSLRSRLGVDALALDEESALHLDRLPQLHRDPFDRMLVCQALVHGLAIWTPDEQIQRYPARTIW